MRDHLFALKYGYNPNQPRVPKGEDGAGQWVALGGNQVAGGSAVGWRVRLSRTDFPGATNGQLVRIEQSIARSEAALQEIRQFDPYWRPRTASLTTPGSVDVAISNAEARAVESEGRLEQLRTSIGGNRGPALDESSQGTNSRAFDGQGWIQAYRSTNNTPDLFGRPTWRAESGTVAVTQVDGKLYFGVNSSAPGYTDADRSAANASRWELYSRDAGTGRPENLGSIPYDSAYHAEATVLQRAARDNGGLLTDRYLEVHVDRDMCRSCDKTLPQLGLQLGNPTVTFVNTKTGERSTMRNGQWLP
ncbi:MAG: hypothetical protein WCK17_17755, partial [Verrucomicrobiota bacterium]